MLTLVLILSFWAIRFLSYFVECYLFFIQLSYDLTFKNYTTISTSSHMKINLTFSLGHNIVSHDQSQV